MTDEDVSPGTVFMGHCRCMTYKQTKNECAERNYMFQYLIPNFPYQEDKMGISNRRLEEEEYKESIARAIALESGVIKECEFHSGTYID